MRSAHCPIAAGRRSAPVSHPIKPARQPPALRADCFARPSAPLPLRAPQLACSPQPWRQPRRRGCPLRTPAAPPSPPPPAPLPPRSAARCLPPLRRRRMASQPMAWPRWSPPSCWRQPQRHCRRSWPACVRHWPPWPRHWLLAARATTTTTRTGTAPCLTSWRRCWRGRCGCAQPGDSRGHVSPHLTASPACRPPQPTPTDLRSRPRRLQEASDGVEAATQLLARLCERVLRSQPALGAADRAALLAAAPRFRREAAAAFVAAQPGGCSWAGVRGRGHAR